MKRKNKNILMLILILILISSSVFTIYHLKNNINTEEIIKNDDKTPPNMENGNMEEPPEKPDGESNNTENTPPEKPDGETTQSEKSDSDNNEMMSQPDNMEMQPMNKENNSSNISNIYYILLGIQSLLMSLLIIYLLMSKFNKKNIKETFKTNDKLIICLLSSIILTALLISSEIYIINNYITNNSVNKNQNGMNENTNINYTGTKEINEDTEIKNEEYKSENENENAILVDGDIKVTLENTEVEKTGDSTLGDDTSFYGINSAIIAKSGSNLTIKNLTLTTDAIGANGVFSYGGSATTKNTTSDGTTITISDSKITTKKDNSGGIMATGGGIIKASNLDINTSGVSSAAIRSDRGGGIVEVDGGTYTTNGSGSPSIYSTAKITVNNATLTSNVSEGIIIEGKNSVEIDNCELTDNNTKLNGLSTTYKNIFLYQSMSGDADTGTSNFTAKNSKITTNNGDTFYITNTTSIINLTNNTIVNNDSNGNFLRAQADSWGNSGSNGGEVTLSLTNQKVTGNIVIDNISTLNMTIKTNSYYEGTINKDNKAKNITLSLDKNSKIKLTGDSYITSLNNELTDNSNIDFNGYKLYVNNKEIK